MNNIIKRKWNQNSMVIIEDLQGMAFQAESGGHTFQISGIDGEGNTVALSGTPAGVMLRADGQDVTLTCSVSGGVVSATLPANAYSVPGRFGLTIFLTSDGQKTAIYAAVGTVGKTSSGTVAPPAGSDVVDLVNAIAAAVASIPASATNLMAAIAPTYSNTALYAVGQYAWYDGVLKRCIVPITTAESYTAAHWTNANLGGDVADLKSATKRNGTAVVDLAERNQFDILSGIEFENGSIDSAGGETSSSIRIRSGFIKIPADRHWLTYTCNGSYQFFQAGYKDIDGNPVYKDQGSFRGSGTLRLTNDIAYLRIVIKNGDNNIAPSEAINVMAVSESIQADTENKVNRLDDGVIKFASDDEIDLLIGIPFEQGTLSSGADGSVVNNRIRSAMVDIPFNAKYLTLKVGTGYLINFDQFKIVDGDYVYVKETESLTSRVFALEDEVVAFRVVVKASNGSNNIKPSEAINVSIYANKEYEVSGLYGSQTENILDLSQPPIVSKRITDDAPYFVNNSNNARLSQPIYVKGLSKVHLHSSLTTSLSRWCAFTTDTSMTGDSVLKVVAGLNTNLADVTLTVPAGAVWLYITLGFGSNDYSSTTVSIGQYKTTESYAKGEPKGIVINGEPIEINSDTAWIQYENERVKAKYIPWSVGSTTPDTNTGTQYDRVNLVFFTDNHIDYYNAPANIQNVKNTMDFVNSMPITVDALINGGDAITPFNVQAKDKEKAVFKKFFDEAKRSQVPFIFAKGNHDLNDWNNTPANTFDDDDWSDMFLDYAETKYGIVRQIKSSGKKSTWHYYDIEPKRVRIICVDVQDTDKTKADANGKVFYYGGKAWYISQEQMSWIINTALDFDDKDNKDWGVVIVSHQGRGYGDLTGESPAFENAIQKLQYVLEAFNTQSTYSSTFTFETDSFFDMTISADFTRYSSETKPPHVICWLLGHEHCDKYTVVNGINTIWTLCAAVTNDSEKRVARVPNSTTQNVFDLISIDTTQRKIRYIRYGAGDNAYGASGDRFLPDGLSY